MTRARRGRLPAPLAVAVTATLTGVLTAPAVLTPAGALAQARDSQVQNIILLIGDGMGRTHVTAARDRFVGAAGRLEMEKAPVVGQVATYAVEEGSTQPALVTDSASSATAWASGVKTYNAALGVDAFGRRVDTLMEQAKRAGMRTGNVSTAEITDATPAGMVSHVLLRGCQGPVFTEESCLGGRPRPADATVITPVAEQIARNGVADVILGGGLARFEPDDQRALTDQGYTVLGSFGDPALQAGRQTAATQRVATRADLEATDAQKVIGLFNRGNLTVETTKAATSTAVTQEPDLAAMTTKAISLLAGKTDKGFLLQVEGALIDKRSHANDATQTLGEMKAFDDAVKVAKDFAARDGKTLVITTADHECAGFSIIEPGTFTNAEAVSPPGNADSSNPANNSTPLRTRGGVRDTNRSDGVVNGPSTRPAPSVSASPSSASDSTNTGVTGASPTAGASPAPSPRTDPFGSADPVNFAPATFRTPDDPADVRDGDERASLWLSYLSGNHTGEDVPLYATGPESGRFAGSQDNTDLYRDMYAALRALGNQSTAPVAAAAPLQFRVIVQGRGNGRVVVAVNDVATPQPGARVDVYYVDRGRERFVRRLQLTSRGTTTVSPAVFSFRPGMQQTFVVRVAPSTADRAVTRSPAVTTYVS